MVFSWASMTSLSFLPHHVKVSFERSFGSSFSDRICGWIWRRASGSIYCWWLKTGSHQLSFLIYPNLGLNSEFPDDTATLQYGGAGFFLSNEYVFFWSTEQTVMRLELVFPSWKSLYQGLRNPPSFIEFTSDSPTTSRPYSFFNRSKTLHLLCSLRP